MRQFYARLCRVLSGSSATRASRALDRGAAIVRFIADFLAPAQRLVIEVDGAYHGERPAVTRAGMRRSSAGYRVIRIARHQQHRKCP